MLAGTSFLCAQTSEAAAAVTATAAFSGTDSTTQGDWPLSYGADGYDLPGGAVSNPSYASPVLVGQKLRVWSTSTTDPRALQSISNPSVKTAETWYTTSSMVLDTRVTDSVQHQIALYLLDWDGSSRRETITVLDVNNNVLATHAVTASFHSGIYLIWNVKGRVRFLITNTSGSPDAVETGLFFGGAASSNPVSISITPATSSLSAAQTQQFTAAASNGAKTAVTWSVSPAVGSISSQGLYTAPASVSARQVITVTAASTVNPAQKATASVTLTPVSVTVSPTSDSLTASQTQQFAAVVAGTTNTSVTWSLAPASGAGTLSSTGLFTAPPSVSAQETATITATSAADTSKKATASVTLMPAQTSTVLLPIEVMGKNGTIQTVRVTVPSQANLSSNKMQMTINNLSYDNKVSVQVNGGSWIQVNSQTATLMGLAKAYGGIGGGFSTIQFTLNLPAGELKYGANTVSFQFVTTDGVSSGFRVLAFNFLNPDGSQILPQSQFTNDNPATWQPPSTLASDIAAGKTLFQTSALTSPGPSGSPVAIKAHCGDCHTSDGRDLKYFNFSNYSIQTRAEFHGLTAAQGNQIASYIRTLNVPSPGLPWNPPYQPGPGLDSQPVANWAAGAGLNAVLSSDAAMLPYVSPNQSSADFSQTGYLNIRNTPVAFQLPDWNRWLPRIHPVDVWGNTFTQSTVSTMYNQFSSSLIAGNTQSYLNQQDMMNRWSEQKNDFIASVPTPNYSTSTGTLQRYSLNLWQLVKIWELNQEFGLEGMNQALYGSQGEPRGWTTNIPFQTSPNISGIPPGAPGIGNGSVATFNYFSFMWYYSQLILNDGDKQIMCTNPVDWGYFYGIIGNMSADNGPQAVLLLTMMQKALQLSDNGNGPQVGCLLGWSPMVNDPSRLISEALPNLWTGLSAAQTSALVNAYVGAWYSVFQHFTPQQFYAGGFTTANEAITPGYTEGNMASRFASMIPHLKFLGLNQTIVTDLLNWGKSAWPGYNWSIIQNSTCQLEYGVVQCTSDQ